jgi:two-component system, NarL family, response regulator LiaR
MLSNVNPDIAFTSSPVRILIVEDDPVMQLGLSELLEDQPQFEIVALIGDGYAAIAQALHLKPTS